MTDDVILARMRKAAIPPYAYTSSLVIERHNELAHIAANRQYLSGPTGLNSYVLGTGTNTAKAYARVTKLCAVFAKEMVLQQRRVRYCTLPELVGNLEAHEPAADLEDVYGRGHIFVGDMGNNALAYPATVWQDVQAFLFLHLARGGALVVGMTVTRAMSLDMNWSYDMSLALTSFTQIEVG